MKRIAVGVGSIIAVGALSLLPLGPGRWVQADPPPESDIGTPVGPDNSVVTGLPPVPDPFRQWDAPQAPGPVDSGFGGDIAAQSPGGNDGGRP